jgi:septal ring factor EnvC (AmiA/AmiB activator)
MANATKDGVEELAQLEQKINKVVAMLGAVRSERDDLRRRLTDQERELRALREQSRDWDKERAGVRSRVEKVLEQVEVLTQAAADA